MTIRNRIRNLIRPRTTSAFVTPFVAALACLVAIGTVASLAPRAALARPEASPSTALRCGTVGALGGVVAILDSERREFREVATGGPVYCGDWISTENGHVALTLPSIGKVTVGPKTFLQLLDPAGGENPEHDDLVLYRGDASYESASSAKSRATRIITPNARVVLGGGRHVLSYSEDLRSSQLIALSGTSTIENRFLKHAPWKVASGHFSTLTENATSKGSRVLPSSPLVPDPKGLDAKLSALAIDATARRSFFEEVSALMKRKDTARLATKAAPVSARTADAKQGASSSKGLAASNENARKIAPGRVPASVAEGAGAPEEPKRFFGAADLAPALSEEDRGSSGSAVVDFRAGETNAVETSEVETSAVESTELPSARAPASSAEHAVKERVQRTARAKAARSHSTAASHPAPGRKTPAIAGRKMKTETGMGNLDNDVEPNERKRLLDRLSRVEEEDGA